MKLILSSPSETDFIDKIHSALEYESCYANESVFVACSAASISTGSHAASAATLFVTDLTFYGTIFVTSIASKCYYKDNTRLPPTLRCHCQVTLVVLEYLFHVLSQ